MKNRKLFDYEIIQKFVAGMELQGFEAKSLRLNEYDITNAHVSVDKEAFLEGIYIKPHNSPWHSSDGKRRVKLLLTKKEIDTLRGNQVILTEVFRHVGRNKKFKAEIAIVKKLKKYDHRAKLKQKAEKRDENTY